MDRRRFFGVVGAAMGGIALHSVVPTMSPLPTIPGPDDPVALNAALFDKLQDPGNSKTAVDAVHCVVRQKLREDGFFRRILPPTPVSNHELS